MALIPVGKLTPQQLHEAVFKYRGYQRPEVLLGSSLGEDAAVIAFGPGQVVVSTDPITGASCRSGWLAVHVAANDVLCSGAEPVACLITILAPLNTEESKIAIIMKEASEAAQELQMEICGGHTEVTDSVNRIIISTVVLGIRNEELFPGNLCIEPDSAIVVSKPVGLEGSAILARDYHRQLSGFMESSELEELSSFFNSISVARESRIAVRHGVMVMHDVTEGGILGALFEMSLSRKMGFTLEEEAIPIHPLTHKLCQIMHADPLRLISSGCLIIVCRVGETLVKELREQGMDAAVVGHFTSRQERIMLRRDSSSGCMERHIIDQPSGDALWDIQARLTPSVKHHDP